MNMNGIHFKNYKSFSGKEVFIESFPNMTIFIGKNNSGKSSCIDVLECLTNPKMLMRNYERGLRVRIEHILTKGDISSVFHKNFSGGGIIGDHYSFGEKYIGKKASFLVTSKQERSFTSNERSVIFDYEWVADENVFPNDYEIYWRKLASSNVNDWSRYLFRRLGAERNIVPEKETDSEELDMTGAGASNLVRKIVNYSQYDEKMIESTLLEALNSIIYPDSQYSGIRVQQIDHINQPFWEIFLQEGDRRFALSQMGSGLKTVVLVLLNLLVIPQMQKYRHQKIIYAFEELENNLHPALQRRLFEYLYKYSCENNVLIILTTHSHVAINTFCDKDFAQVLHVTKQNGISTLHRIDNYFAKSEILNDLDVRASDLLQANGIIWVEGPSDRIYIKRWIEIWCEDELQEGRDYQFLYYGGRLLSHFTAETEQSELINVLLTNRNAAIVMDSDKRSVYSHINGTKKRIQQEFSNANSFCWITHGKEIENYIPNIAIDQALEVKTKAQCGPFDHFPDYISDLYPQFGNEKVLFAQKVSKFITLENSVHLLDLKGQVERLIEVIHKWNPKY